MTIKQQQLDDPTGLALYRDLAETIDWEPNDPRLPAIGDKLVALLETTHPPGSHNKADPDEDIPDDLARLLDQQFLDLVPAAPRFLQLLHGRGWTGWTNIRRIAASQ